MVLPVTQRMAPVCVHQDGRSVYIYSINIVCPDVFISNSYYQKHYVPVCCP